MDEVGISVILLEGYLLLLFLALTLWAFDIFPFDEKNLGSMLSSMPNITRSFFKVGAPIVVLYKAYEITKIII